MNDGNRTVQPDVIDVVLQNIQLYYTPILVYLGSLGNCLSVCVFFCTKLRKSSSSIYLGALAISDTGFLVSVFVVWLNMVGVGLFNQAGFCQFFVYLTTLCSFLSVWFVVAFTVERFVAVQYPFHRQSMCTVMRAKIIVTGLTALGIVLCSPVLWFSGPRTGSNVKGNVTECNLAEGWESWATIFNAIDTILTFALPFTVIVILNALIARTIYRLAKIRSTLTIESSVLKGQRCTQSPRSGAAQTKITKMLLVVSSAFLCFNLPAYVVRVHAFLHEGGNAPRAMELAQQVCNVLFNTNFGINFVLYCATGQNFRTAMCSMLLRRSHTRANTVMSNHGNQFVAQCARANDSSTRQRAIMLSKPWEDFHELQTFPSRENETGKNEKN